MQAFIEHASGWADEGAADQVFLVAGLFAHEDDAGIPRAFPEDHVRGLFIEVATLTVIGVTMHRRQRKFVRDRVAQRRAEYLRPRGDAMLFERARHPGSHRPVVLLQRLARAIRICPPLVLFNSVCLLTLARELAIDDFARAFGGVLFGMIELE
jgi:hypothetical protein